MCAPGTWIQPKAYNFSWKPVCYQPSIGAITVIRTDNRRDNICLTAAIYWIPVKRKCEPEMTIPQHVSRSFPVNSSWLVFKSLMALHFNPFHTSVFELCFLYKSVWTYTCSNILVLGVVWVKYQVWQISWNKFLFYVVKWWWKRTLSADSIMQCLLRYLVIDLL